MKKEITKEEKKYILFNIKGFFKHYKIEQNINKQLIDISNLQKMKQEINNLQNELNEYKEEINSNNLIDNQTNNTLLKVNKRHKFITKSTDKVTQKIIENKQKIKLKDLKYDLNKSNMTLRPKTPDISQIFGKYKKKKANMRNKSNSNLNEKKYNKIGSSSFVQSKKYFTTNKNYNNIIRTNNLNNNFNYDSNYNKTQYNYNKEKRDNSIDSKEIDSKNLNYTITKLPEEIEKINKQNIEQLSKKNKMESKNLSSNKKTNKKNNDKYNTKEYLNNNEKNKINKEYILQKKIIKPKKLKKENMKNKYLNERYHSSDIVKRKDQNNNQNMKITNKIYDKKILKLKFKNRINTKTPSPINYRRPSPLLIDHDTIIKNKNKKINYNGNYYNEHYSNNKKIKKKKSNDFFYKKQKIIINNKNLKPYFNDKTNKKDITLEEERKLEEQIINSNGINDAQNDTQNNNIKNLMDLSQNILQNLEYMNNTDINRNESKGNIINLSDIHNNTNKKNNFILGQNSDNLFSSNYIKSLYLAIKLGFFQPWEKLKLLLISKELNFKFDIKDIINDYINYYEKKIILISNDINKYDMNIINKPFTPKKTGLNSLNFITKNEEQRLINEEQHEYVIKIFTIVLILLNEYDNFKTNTKENDNKSKVFEFLFNDIYQKNNVDNIKDLFIKYFVDKIPLISDIQFNMINDIIRETPELLSPSTLLAYNRNVTYLIFFLSELYNYLMVKANDDIYYYKIRNQFFELKHYINKINKLKIYL